MGFFGGLEQDRYDRQYDDRYLFRRLGHYFREQVRRTVVMSAMSLLVSLVQALMPIIIAAGVGALESRASDLTLALLIGALLLTVIVQYASNWLRRRLTNRIVGDLTSQMRKDALAASVNRDMAFYDENKTGKILSRITSDTEDFGQILIITSDIVSQVVQVFILLAVLFSRDVLLTLIVLVFMLPMVGAALWFRKLARDVTRQGSRAMAAVNDTIQETVTGISVAKNFRQEAAIYDDFVQVNEQSYRVNAGRDQHQHVVSLHPIGGPVLVSADQYRVILEPVSAGDERPRAYLRADRRGKHRPADRPAARRADRRADRI
jgi:ATP-binding cassette subfamily B protein